MLYFYFTPASSLALYVTDLLCFTEIFTFILLLCSDFTPSSLALSLSLSPSLSLSLFFCLAVQMYICIYIHIYIYMLHSCFTPALLLRTIYMLDSCMLTLKYLCIFMLYLCFTPASLLLIYVTAAILLYLNIFFYSPALLVLYSYFSCCVCVCAPTY